MNDKVLNSRECFGVIIGNDGFFGVSKDIASDFSLNLETGNIKFHEDGYCQRDMGKAHVDLALNKIYQGEGDFDLNKTFWAEGGTIEIPYILEDIQKETKSTTKMLLDKVFSPKKPHPSVVEFINTFTILGTKSDIPNHVIRAFLNIPQLLDLCFALPEEDQEEALKNIGLLSEHFSMYFTFSNVDTKNIGDDLNSFEEYPIDEENLTNAAKEKIKEFSELYRTSCETLLKMGE